MVFYREREMLKLAAEAKGAEHPIAISLGGSMLFDEQGKFSLTYIRMFCDLLTKIKSHGKHLVCVVGGGRVARDYCDTIRELGGGHFMADRAGILATRLNAQLLIAVLGNNAYPHVVIDADDAADGLATGKIVVAAGMLEGVTTDADAVLFAERVNAVSLVNVSKVPAIYSQDPEVHPKAKRFKEMTHAELTALAAEYDERKAKTKFPFDLVACKLAQRSNIALHFVDGRDLAEVEKAINGEAHAGTIVKN